MDFQLTTDYSRSASNSPAAVKKYGFQLSLPHDPRQCSSQQELDRWGKGHQCSTLPNPMSRSVSVSDILDEGTTMVNIFYVNSYFIL